MDSNGFIKLRIAGDGIDFNEISDKLGMPADFLCKKGNAYIDKTTKKIITYKEDCWLAESQKSEDETLEECAERFVLKFYSAADYIKKLSLEFDVTFWISVYPDSEQSNVRLSAKTVSAIGEMGASVDFDVMFLREFYEN